MTEPADTPPPIDTHTEEEPDGSPLNVQEYGAVGDGSTDDTSAIRDAIRDATAGDTVYIPATGDAYLVSQDDPTTNGAVFPLDSSVPDGLTIAGDGPGTRLRVAGGHDGATYLWRLDANGVVSGLEFRRMVFDGDRTRQDVAGETFGALWACIDTGADLSKGDVDVRLVNIEAVNAWFTGFHTDVGGVTFERCTVDNSRKHNISIDTDEGLRRPRVEVKACLLTNNVDSGFYGVDCSDGRWLVEDTVIDGCSQGTKISTGFSTGTYRRVRIRNSDNHSFNSSGTDSGGVTFEDCVIGPGNGANFDADHVPYEIADGSELVVTGNDDDAGRAAVLFRSDAEIDASNATVWCNNNKYAGLECQSTTPGNVIGTYYHRGNAGGAVGKTSNLTIEDMGEREKTNIEGVPTADEVGAWSRDGDIPAPIW